MTVNKGSVNMSEHNYFPVTSSRLSNDFPELKHFILENYSRTATIKRGTNIRHDNNEELFYLASGKIKSYAYDENGHEQLMYIFIKDTLIFQSISEHFCKNLVVLENATLYSINYDDVFKFLQTDTNYIRKFINLIATRYGILLQQILTTNRQSAKAKIYSFLLSFADQFGVLQSDDTILLSKFPTLTDIAATTNVHRSNVTAYINELESAGILIRQNHQLIIKDIDALKIQLEETSRLR